MEDDSQPSIWGPLGFNLVIFTFAYAFSLSFLKSSLFAEQELKSANLNQYIFSSTFATCVMMLGMFLLEIIGAQDPRISMKLWKYAFTMLDLLIVLIIPLGLIKSMLFQGNQDDNHQQTTKKKAMSKARALGLCLCFGVFAMTLIMLEKKGVGVVNQLQEQKGEFWEKFKKILTSSKAQLEFFTLLGIILNGLMQGYVTSNTIYVFLIENLEEKVRTSCGIKPGEPSTDKLFQYHAEKIQANLEQIAFYNRKKAKLEYELKRAKHQLETHQEAQNNSGSTLSVLTNWFGMSQASKQNKKNLTGVKQIEAEVVEFEKEIELLNELHQQYANDLNEFARWKQTLEGRRTCLGKLGYLIGLITAVVFIIRFYNACRNLQNPNYIGESMNRTVKWFMIHLGLYREEYEAICRMVVHYISVLIMMIIISLNVKSFMNNLLVSVKNLLRDASLIKTNYNTNILIFAFIMATYYLQTILGLSMNLQPGKREPFNHMLDRFTYEFVLQTQDLFMVSSSVMSAIMIYFNHAVYKRITSLGLN